MSAYPGLVQDGSRRGRDHPGQVNYLLTYLGILEGRLPVAQVGPLRECRGPGVVHTGAPSLVLSLFQVGTVPPYPLCVFCICCKL
jgi:hypothetical protein